MRAPLTVLLAALGLLCPTALSPALGNNTDARAPLRVTLDDGTTKVGQPRWKGTRLELTGRAPAKLECKRLRTVSDPYPPYGEHYEALVAEHSQRAQKANDAKAWRRVGEWAAEQGLSKQAKQAFERAIAADPDDAGARAGLGFMKVGDAWRPTAEVIAERVRALDPKSKGLRRELYKLSRLAERQGAPLEAIRLLSRGLRLKGIKKQDQKQGIKQLRPLTDRYVHRVELSPPLRGRWKANEDVSRHHSKLAGAAYALDLIKVDEDGDHFSTGGRRKLEAHYAYGQGFYAAAPGRVVFLRDGHPDLPIGELGPGNTSNMVAIDHGHGEATWYNHAQPGSITVKQGEEVKRGQLLGKIGNSGKSSIPHLHFALTVEGWAISIPWRLRDYELKTPKGWVKVTQACPREGWTLRFPTPGD